MAEQFHLPVLAGHERIRLAAVVDRDERRARAIAERYGIPVAVDDAAKLQAGTVHAAVIATPPFHHHPCSIALMRQGIHVFVEKPMAVDLPQAREMVEVSEQQGVVLSVGLYKRLLPVTRLLRRLISEREYGQPRRFSFEWGGLGGFASATLGLLRKEQAGGGVLIDLGSHAFDQLVAVFGGEITIDDYQDDARGGVEADCQVVLRAGPPGQEVSGTVLLSRVRNLSGVLEIECDRATLSAAVNERFEVTVRWRDGRPPLVVREFGPTDISWFEGYRAEIDDFCDAVIQGGVPQLSGASALPAVRAVDACYRQRHALSVPWFMAATPNPAVRSAKRKRVLITGAGGFIGGRAAEILFQRGDWDIRAMVRQPANAARIARLGVDLVQGDLRSEEDTRRALDGCDAVLHAAVGTDYGSPLAIRAVTVDGTARIASAARRLGVQRFVHISTIGVHDPTRPGVLDGFTAAAPRKGDWYGETKALAEQAVRREEQAGLSVAIIRPGCVYGPHGFTFVINTLRALRTGSLVVVDDQTVANTVFVDNLVEALVRGLEAPGDQIRGQVFPISDGDSCTWSDYYGDFAERMGTPLRHEPPTVVAPAVNPGLLAGMRAALLSAEAKSFAKRVLNSDPLGTIPRRLLERFPAVETSLRDLVGMNEPEIYRRPSSDQAADSIRISGWRPQISIEHARTGLRYSPPFTPQEARRMTWDWAQYARIV
jgi:predicted dehydrogenase/nucleoside-diphosphate-sugar epimerase